MNDLEVTMQKTTDTPKPPEPRKPKRARVPGQFDVHVVALEVAVMVAVMCKRVPRPMTSTAEQAIKAAGSVAANLQEGMSRTGKDRLHKWKIAYGEAREVDRHLLILIGTGDIPEERGSKALELLDRVRAMTWRLMHPRR